MRISDWSSDVCSSDLRAGRRHQLHVRVDRIRKHCHHHSHPAPFPGPILCSLRCASSTSLLLRPWRRIITRPPPPRSCGSPEPCATRGTKPRRSEEHKSELQSLMRISYAAFCLTKKKKKIIT